MERMNCTIGAPNVKSLAKAIQTLARIGEDLYVESLSNSLIFRTVSSSRSAYVCFTFKPSFFIQYQSSSDAKFKVSLKSCLMAFRSLPAMEKNVEKCVLDAGLNDCALVIQFHCKHDLTEVYSLPFIENETVQAGFKDQLFQLKITAQSRLLSDGFQNFSTDVDEVTLSIATDALTIKNHVDNDDVDKNKMIFTELTLEADEFEHYDVTEEVEVTFCLKEMKTLLSFAEGFNVPVTIKCHSAGKPISFNINGLPGIEAEFVLATLADKGSTQAESVVSEPTRPSKARKAKKPRIEKKNGESTGHVSSVSEMVESAVDSVDPFSTRGEESVPEMMCADEAETSRFLAMCSEDNNENENDCLLPSPPQKRKFRDLFLGLSQAAEYTSMMPEPDEVLAVASDMDD